MTAKSAGILLIIAAVFVNYGCSSDKRSKEKEKELFRLKNTIDKLSGDNSETPSEQIEKFKEQNSVQDSLKSWNESQQTFKGQEKQPWESSSENGLPVSDRPPSEEEKQ